MLSSISDTASIFSFSPPSLNDEKKPGPTCKPIIKTNSISPKSCTNDSVDRGAVNPRCPARMPANNTKVTPSDIPPTFNLPRYTPVAITTAYSMAMCAILSLSTKRLISQSIFLSEHFYFEAQSYKKFFIHQPFLLFILIRYMKIS